MHWDTLWINTHLATMDDGPDDGFIHRGAIASYEGKIAWIGAEADLPAAASKLAAKVYDGAGAWLTPGFIDCHTHLVYSGQRSNEFAMRLQGISYAEIAARGGGIHATVAATRKASAEQLYLESSKRLRHSLSHGVTAIEIKSGYGLDLETEAKILDVARQLGDNFGIKVQKTYLGAHVCPQNGSDANAYIDALIKEYLPELVRRELVDAVDVYCEHMAFSLAQCERVFQAAHDLALPIKCHAEQFTAMGASRLSARYHALSVDHLEYATAADVEAIARSGTVAVLLPGAFYMLGEKQSPPIALLRANHVPIALATDCNPGTSPITSLPLIMNMACVLWRLTPMEALKAVTIHAARAMGEARQRGVLAIGARADYALWNVAHPEQICANLDAHFHIGTIVAGHLQYEKSASRSTNR